MLVLPQEVRGWNPEDRNVFAHVALEMALAVLGWLPFRSRPEEHMVVELLDEIFETAAIFKQAIAGVKRGLISDMHNVRTDLDFHVHRPLQTGEIGTVRCTK